LEKSGTLPDPYRLSLADLALDSLIKGKPLALIGMGGNGKSYIYNLLQSSLGTKIKNNSAFVYLSGINGDEKGTFNALKMSLEVVGMKIRSKTISDTLNEIVQNIKPKNRFSFVINGGYNEELNEEFLQGISRLTYQTQRRVNYIFFLNVSNLNKRSFQNRVIKNLIMSHIIPILPLNYDNSKDVLYNNEEKYGVEIKNNDVKEKIISLSGGHPGLLKAIYLQAKDIAGWSEPDYGDIQLSTRSMDILNELDGEKKEILVNPKLNKNDPAKSELYGFLTFYGYLNQNGEVFSPILTEYLKREYNKDVSTSIMQENILISLTKQQREAMQMFFENRGRIVRREELAEFLWGDTAHEDYSDWALDQFIHTLRNKIKSISGLGKIVTKKGEGYLYKK